MTTIIDLTGDEHEPMESTCDDLLASNLPQQGEVPGLAEQQTLKVYLRVRPFSKEELHDNEDQGCVVMENSQTVVLHAPKGSATMMSSERGIGLPLHKFSFSQIFGPEATQVELFEDTVKSQVSDYLDGKNAFIFCYGVTNAGKTYTVQGTLKEPGILPQALDATFQHIGGYLYEGMNLKPYLYNDAQHLGPDQVKQEKSAKAAIFSSFKEECHPLGASGSRSSSTSLDIGLSCSAVSCEQTVKMKRSPTEGSSLFALWVAFYEIYNECVYDLLQSPFCTKSKKRTALRLCEDASGNTYVRDLKWINIQNLEEASKVLRYGNKNRSAASTKLNQSSSRSHSIFTMKLLKICGTTVERISEFSLCDLAGSERCGKTKTFGERLKEAGNINGSLLILGKCITALRNNQTDRTKSSNIPFRESKLTKLFQAVFLGKGRASMMVNINQCASTYDETLHVMKFSAIAKEVTMIPSLESLVPLVPRLVGHDGKPLDRDGVIDSQALESYLSEEEMLDDEADMSILPQKELVNVIENLQTRLLAERRKNLVQEFEIRKEMGDAMLQQLMESERLCRQQIAKLKERQQQKLEDMFEIYKEDFKAHAYQCAMARVEDNYVPLQEFIAEQEKVEQGRLQIEALRSKLSERLHSVRTGVCPVPGLDQADGCCSTFDTSMETEAADDDRCKLLYKEKRAMEKMCEDKQRLIVSLEKRLQEQNETIQKKSNDLEALQEEAKSLAEILMEKDKEIASIKAELSNQPKTKRGLLANIRDSVTSPRNGAIGRTLRRNVRTASLNKKTSS